MPKLMPTVAQLRADLIKTQVPRPRIAQEADVGERTVDQFLRRDLIPRVGTLTKLEAWYEQWSLSRREDRVQ